MALERSPGSAPLVVTERLELWVPTKGDVWAMHAIVTDPATRRFLGPMDTRAEHFQRFGRNAGSWLLYGYGAMLLRERDSGELVGNAGIFHSYRGLGDDFDDCPEAGWIVRHDRVGRGYGSEAITAAIGWFEREHGAQRIVCMISPGNAPSLRLADKLGFTPMRDAELPQGEVVRLFERLPGTR